jgi:hypothetical protein
VKRVSGVEFLDDLGTIVGHALGRERKLTMQSR